MPCTCSTLAIREEVIAYSDADWAGCTETRRSTSCCLIFWGDVLLRAHARTQVQIGLSSPESEFCGCCGAAAELLSYKGLLNFLGYATKGRLMMDASSAIAIATRSGVGSSAPPRGEVFVGSARGREQFVLS